MRVMRLLTRPNLGGPTVQAVALWHAMAAQGVRTLLVVGRCGPDEEAMDLTVTGIPPLAMDQAVDRGTDAAGWVDLPELARRPGPLRDRKATAAVRRLLASYGPRVLHTHTTKAGLVGRRAARDTGVRTVHTFHGHVLRDHVPAPIARYLRWIERRMAAATDTLVAVSASCADELAAFGVAPRHRFTVVPPAVPAVAAAPIARNDSGEPFAVAGAGRLVPVKGWERFLEAAHHMPAVPFLLFGTGPLRRQLAAAAPANVRWMGSAPDLPEQLARVSAVVISSLREGYPLVGVEAMAAGVPVVGFDVPGVRDLLAEGGGELVPEAAGGRGLARVLQRWAAGEEERLALGRVAQSRTAVCHPDRVASQLLALYSALQS